MREHTKEINVPAGVEDGTRIRYQEEGEAGLNGGPSGDLYVVLHVKEHEFFEREGTTLHCAIPISFPQAALGTELEISTLEGEHKLKIPAGTQSGDELTIKGKGVPVLQGRGRGDLVITIIVQTPIKLNKRQTGSPNSLQQSKRNVRITRSRDSQSIRMFCSTKIRSRKDMGTRVLRLASHTKGPS